MHVYAYTNVYTVTSKSFSRNSRDAGSGPSGSAGTHCSVCMWWGKKLAGIVYDFCEWVYACTYTSIATHANVGNRSHDSDIGQALRRR